MGGNVTRFPGRQRPHVVRQPSPAEQLHGVCDDLMLLAKGPNEHSVLAIIRRIEAIAERLGKPGGAA